MPSPLIYLIDNLNLHENITYIWAPITAALLRNEGPGSCPSYFMVESLVPWKWAYYNVYYLIFMCNLILFVLIPTSKSAAKLGTTGTSKLFELPAAEDFENFQNFPSWYWGSMSEETIGKALKKKMCF